MLKFLKLKHGVQMEKQMNNVKKEIDNLFKEIKQTTLYKDYLRSKRQLEENDEIMNVISEIKRLQKIGTNNKDDIIEENIKYLYIKLESYPLYQSYLVLKEELENKLNNISNSFNNYFYELLKLDVQGK